MVNRLLVISAPGTVKASLTTVITGNIRPRAAGASVQLEKLVGKEWKPVDQAIKENEDILPEITVFKWQMQEIIIQKGN